MKEEIMKQLSLMIDLNRCTGCNTCIVACRNYHELVDHTSALPGKIPYYLRVESYRKGIYPNLSVDTWITPCQHCFDPPCMLSCPEEAISKDPETGIVLIDNEKCTGCEAILGDSVPEKQGHSSCKVRCPAHINIQAYISLASKGKYREALKVIKEECPLPATVGRVCHHPCELECERGSIDSPVAINAIKRFVADLDLNSGSPYIPKIKRNKDDKIAIVGSGPAGLSCAYYLAIEGYKVTIFEKAQVLGGMLILGIPDYRLPRDVVNSEIQIIREMGVTMKTGIEIGKDLTIEQLRQDGFKAFFISIGTQKSKRLGIDGENLGGVYAGIEFLRKVNLGEEITLGKRVAVIGGGMVAMDTARTARRLGAREAFIIYRRGMDEMLVSDEEIEESQEEDISIKTLLQPVKFIGDNDQIRQVVCVKMRLTELDETGRKKPEPITGSEIIFDVDTVITAIGEEADWAGLAEELSSELFGQGMIKVNPLTLQSHKPDVFSGGDVVTGPKTVIEAIESGKQAAISIDRYLKGFDLEEGRNREGLVKVANVQKEKYNTAKRGQVPRLEPHERAENFNEVQKGFTEEMVKQETKRCLNCGCACIQACPYDVIQFNNKEGFSHKCDLCFDRIHVGEVPVCVEVCLTDAIIFGEYELIKQRAIDTGLDIRQDISKESILYVK